MSVLCIDAHAQHQLESVVSYEVCLHFCLARVSRLLLIFMSTLRDGRECCRWCTQIHTTPIVIVPLLLLALLLRQREYLHSTVDAVRDDDAALLIDRHSMRTVELAIS